MRSALVVLVLLLGQEANAAKAKKPEKEAPAPAVVKEEPKKALPQEDPKEKDDDEGDPSLTNKPRTYGSGYKVWGTRGGATLGGVDALRLSGFGGTHSFGDGYGNGGLEAFYFFSSKKGFDFGLGLRISGYPLGFAPGFEMRGQLVNAGKFRLAFSFHANAQLNVRYMFGGLSIAAHAELGLLMSYFFTDNIEFIFGPMAQGTLLFVALSLPVPQLGIVGRLGMTYTFKKSDIGLFQITDIGPGWYAPYGRPRATSTLAAQRAEAYFLVAVNFLIGVQVKL